jgi:hypothetical protein
MALGSGTTATIDDGASSAHVAIPGLLSVTAPDPEIGSYDDTDLSSTPGTLVKAPLSRAEPGSISLRMKYTAAQFTRFELLRAEAATGVLSELKVTWPDAEVTTADGWVSKVTKSEVQNQERMEMTVTFVCSELPVTA